MNRYSTQTVLAMVEEVEGKRSFWKDLAFSNTVFFDTDVVTFDIKLGGKPVAPFVSPMVKGTVRRRDGYASKTMKPAYLKLSGMVAPTDALMRTAGEGFNNAQLTPAQRMNMLMAQEIQMHAEMVDNRLEWMCAKTILEGGYMVSGDGYQPTYVDFGHSANLKFALAGAMTWDQATSRPVDNLEDWAQAIRVESKGAIADTVIMDPKAWQLIRRHPDIKDRLNADFAAARMNKTSIDDGIVLDPIGLSYMGRLDSKLDLYVYQDFLTDASGADLQLMPDYTCVVMAKASMEGMQLYGAILDSDAGFQAMKMHTKSRTSWDPAGEEVLSQSAPLVAPKRANTWAVASVI